MVLSWRLAVLPIPISRLILDLADRFARYRQVDIDSLHLSRPLSLPELKAKWTAAIEEGRHFVESLPVEDVGWFYLDPKTRQPVTPDPASSAFTSLLRHHGSVGGSWPVIINP